MNWAARAVAVSVLVAAPLGAAQTVGKPAGNFRLWDAKGQLVELGKFRGRTVVLEWHNPECPIVRKHYDSGNMQRTQAAAQRQGVVWLTINSGAPGKQGHMTAPQAAKQVAADRIGATHYLLDVKGVVGKGYAARTTPHMYIIGADGTLAYQGAIDDKPTSDKADIPAARNHVLAALGELKANKPVSVAQTEPYGCSVKYAG